ncbi:MAG: hypothetical protein EOP48_05105 [Sphingobacteriales bacterium]|nr:MAG: hypothetical protein EOP48_05105 [Sphingobacteriales bacterium]
MNSDDPNNALNFDSIEPAVHEKFTELLTKHINLVEENKDAFINHDNIHKDQSAQEIYSTYWSLQATSSNLEAEHLKLTRKDSYTTLPNALRALIN